MDSDRKLLVGIDEAGYGPNLGPLVVAAVWAQVPQDARSDSLWQRLGPAVSRHPPSEPDAIVIDDSKKVYSGGSGLDQLERTALAWLGFAGNPPATLRQLWTGCCLTPAADLDENPWYAEQDVGLPRLLAAEQLDAARRDLCSALTRAGCDGAGLACQIIMPRRFNELVRRGSSKAAALFQVNAELLRHVWQVSPASRIEVVLDKHGGRNFYGALLQQEFSETLVWVGREGRAASHYSLASAGRELRASFLPRADSAHLLVAAASMVAKYLRELWMELFNAYWTRQLPGLEPTAGYPSDSRRFWTAIRPLTRRLRLDKQLVWRSR
jgi:hypothetical protein